MGQCIAIETARAGRALRKTGAPIVTTRMLRENASGARRVNERRSGIRRILSGWLWGTITKTLGAACGGTQGQARSGPKA